MESLARAPRRTDPAGCQPVGVWEEDLGPLMAELRGIAARGVADVEGYLTCHPRAVERMIACVRDADLRRKMLEHFGAIRDNVFRNGLHATLLAESKPDAIEIFGALARGVTLLSKHTRARGASGEDRELFVALTIPGDPPDPSRAVVIVADTTGRGE